MRKGRVETQEVRRGGGGKYYLVNVDQDGNSTEIYVNGVLLTFDDCEDAKDYIEDNLVVRRSRKERSSK